MEDEVTIPKEQLELMVLQAQIELLQRVNRLVQLLEQQQEVKPQPY